MKAIYWKDLKAEDRRLWLIKHTSDSFPFFLTIIICFLGSFVISMFLSLSILTALDTNAIANNVLSSNITAYNNWNNVKSTFAEVVSSSYEPLPQLALVLSVLCIIEVILSCFFDKYDKFHRQHFKYATKEVDFSKWVKDKIDGKII